MQAWHGPPVEQEVGLTYFTAPGSLLETSRAVSGLQQDHEGWSPSPCPNPLRRHLEARAS